MSAYSVEKLMSETRRLAAEYRRSTGTTLPVSIELAKYDAIRLLNLTPAADSETHFDAIGQTAPLKQLKLAIKGRVIFDQSKKNHRVEQLNTERNWDGMLLTLLDSDYHPTEIFYASKQTVHDALGANDSSTLSKRGSLSVAKFKAIGQCLWEQSLGLTNTQITG